MSKKSKNNQDAKRQRRALVEELIDDNLEANVLESLKGRWAENSKKMKKR